MSKIKYNRVRKLSDTARYPRTFAACLGYFSECMLGRLTAAEIAELIDAVAVPSYHVGHDAGYADATE